MDYGTFTIMDIQNGYQFDEKAETYTCNFCEKSFPIGQVFSIGEHFYEPRYAVTKHIDMEHGGSFRQLLNSDTKYNTITDTQKELLCLFHSNVKDADIAKKLGVSASTVRHQKFSFREKAKQAKFYLAIYEHVFADKADNREAIIPIHDQAVYVDDRYVTTQEERAHVLETFFTSLVPLRLKLFSPKEKNKVVILSEIVEQFETGKEYLEKEVNEILKDIYDDYASLRRYLISYGFMKRTKDCSKYWRI